MKRVPSWVIVWSVGWLTFGVLALFWAEPCPTGPSTRWSPSPPQMTMTRVPGPDAVASRCPECAQLGDIHVISVSGPVGLLRGIRVYRDSVLMASCDGCSSLSIMTSLLGRYVVVGHQELFEDGPCLVPMPSMDQGMASLYRCDAAVVTGAIVVR